MNIGQKLLKMKDISSEYEIKSKSTPVAMVAPELKQNNEADTEISKTCAVLGCEDSKNMEPESFFRFPEHIDLRQIWANLTGRNNWTPTDYSYICSQHFSVDCFSCDAEGNIIINEKAVPSLKLPNHVLEVEYIDEETLDNEDGDYDEFESDYDEMDEVLDNERLVNGNSYKINKPDVKKEVDLDLLKLFSEVQNMQRQALNLRKKLRCKMKMHSRQGRFLKRLRELIEVKKNILNQKQKRKSKILLSLQDKIKEDTSGLVLAMPNRHTDDLKNFALSIYKYSPQAYIYIRNSLRTILPSSDVLDEWLNAGYQPKNTLTNNNSIKLISEQTEKELCCKVILH